MAGLAEINGWPPDKAVAEFKQCCGSTAWAGVMAGGRPYATVEAVHRAAEAAWARMGKVDILEAFAAHPRIGGKAPAKSWAAGEQAGVAGAPDAVLEQLAKANERYVSKFGYIFIICAAGKTAAEMLKTLGFRLGNKPEDEILVAADEQARITRIRLAKLLDSP